MEKTVKSNRYPGKKAFSPPTGVSHQVWTSPVQKEPEADISTTMQQDWKTFKVVEDA
jgi:hypothetical protein